MATTTHDHDDLRRAPLRERMAMPRRRGGIVGGLLLLAGIWGALIPFAGPLFDWTIGPDSAFDMTAGRFWLSLVPGLATIAGALVLLLSANRASAAIGAWLALAAGVWFAAGQTASRIWNDGQSLAGEALGGATKQAVESLTYFEGLGALIIALSAFALGRVTIRSVKDALALRGDREDREAAAPPPDEDRTGGGRFRRDRAAGGEAVPPIGAGRRAPAPSDTRHDAG